MFEASAEDFFNYISVLQGGSLFNNLKEMIVKKELDSENRIVLRDQLVKTDCNIKQIHRNEILEH